jgi:uncharacterized protein
MTWRPRCLWLIAMLASVPAFAGPVDDTGEPRIEPIEFVSHGVKLSGSIAYPPNGSARAAVVFIHGSGKQTRNLAWATRFAQAGIAALVYDKRGAGESGGNYEEQQSVGGPNLSLLADDAVAALHALAARPSLKGVPMGFTGISQAGWIAPLAAHRSRAAKFLVLWSGPVCKVSEEDIYSKFTRDADMGTVPTYQQALSSRTEDYVWPDFLGVDTDPGTSLRELSMPGLWIFGGNDGSIPVDLSISRLKSLQESGHRYEYVLLPGVGHNNMDDTFSTATDWIRRVN